MKPRNVEFKGLAISSGKVAAPVCVYSASAHAVPPARRLETDAEVAGELRRFENVLVACSRELDRIAREVATKVGPTEAEIFSAQKHIMNDAAAVAEIRRQVSEERKNLEWAINHVYKAYEEKFSTLDNEYLRDRSTDIGEIRRRLLDHLGNTRPGFKCQGQGHCSRGKNRIIVAEELSADMMTHMKLESVLGIVTERGGTSSHAAIIARSLGVPAVSGVRGIFSAVACGTELLVDGDDGVVVVEPDAATLLARMPVDAVPLGDACVISTPPGTEVLANASLMEDVQQAAALNADGIGLLRTEILFMRAERLLDENEQFEFYRSVMKAMRGRPVTFRLLDVGGDKELPFLRIEKEANPYLGWRGARFLLGSPEVFAVQVRALVRLSVFGPVNILIPMIVDQVQTGKLVSGIRDIMATEKVVAENVKIGAMFEVPSACLSAEGIFKEVDFGSIGSNDLIQYLFAVDRNNELVSHDYNPEHPVLWSVLQGVSDAAQRTGKKLSICGEMAGRQTSAARLMDIGITSFSVSPRLIPRVRNEIARHLGLLAEATPR